MMIHKIDVFFEENLLKNVVEMLTIKFSKKNACPQTKYSYQWMKNATWMRVRIKTEMSKGLKNLSIFEIVTVCHSNISDLYVKLTWLILCGDTLMASTNFSAENGLQFRCFRGSLPPKSFEQVKDCQIFYSQMADLNDKMPYTSNWIDELRLASLFSIQASGWQLSIEF